MWPILLLLAVAQSSAKESELKIVGCSEHDQQMDYDQYSSKSLPKFNVTYGERVPAKVFTKIKNVELFIEIIYTYFERVIKQYQVNDIDEFIRFYEQVKDVGTEDSFENFYKLGFQSNTSFQDKGSKSDLPYYKFAPTLMSDLCYGYAQFTDNKKFVDSCYLVAVYKKSPRENNTKQTYDLSHIAGAIRINVRGRPGVILMDIGDNAFKPVVLMNDLQHPHMFSMDLNPPQTTTLLHYKWSPTRFLEEPIEVPSYQQIRNGLQKLYPKYKKLRYAGKTFSFEFKKNNKYVIVRNKYDNDSETIYDIERPYCSFLSTTVSRYLYLKTTKRLLTRGERGHISDSVSFDLTEEVPEIKQLKAGVTVLSKPVHEFNQIYQSKVYRTSLACEKEKPLRKTLLAVDEIAKNQKFVEKYKKYHTEMASLNQYEIQL